MQTLHFQVEAPGTWLSPELKIRFLVVLNQGAANDQDYDLARHAIKRNREIYSVFNCQL